MAKILVNKKKIKILQNATKVYPGLEDLVVTPSGVEQNFKSSKYGYDNVKVEAINLQNKELTLNKNGIYTITADDGFSGLDVVEITLDAIEDLDTELNTYETEVSEQKIRVEDIVETLKGKGLIQPKELTVTPTKDPQTIEGIYNKVNIAGDEDLIPENIKLGVNVFGVEGTFGEVIKEKNINFYDYDGTLLHSYTLEEFKDVNELPTLPEQDGLICQGWNWTLEEIKAEEKNTDIGAIYTTDDGSTRLYISFYDENLLTVTLGITQTASQGLEIDWGDGTTEKTSTSTSFKSYTHKYEKVDDYVIKIKSLKDCTFYFTEGSNTSNIVGSINTLGWYTRLILKKLEIGENYNSPYGVSFSYNYNLEKMVLPNHINKFKSDPFRENRSMSFFAFNKNIEKIENSWGYMFINSSLKKVCFNSKIKEINASGIFYNVLVEKLNFPRNLEIIGSNVCYRSGKIKEITLGDKLTTIGSGAFNDMEYLLKLELPNSITSLGSNAIRGLQTISEITLPDEITTLTNYQIGDNGSLVKIKFGKKITTIDGGAFYNDRVLKILDFSRALQVPTLSSTTWVKNVEIRVPSDLYDEWVSTTNWSSCTNVVAVDREV